MISIGRAGVMIAKFLISIPLIIRPKNIPVKENRLNNRPNNKKQGTH